ncbi:cation transporter [Capnocytophaga catalasegens]|uniref:Cation transporter n=2 Tax=Capnocytophaga catalasegens TaxID=1004260 RepID=A0AAV5AZ75_9FLAO|nr:cation transporter [Capnocytophaga catalasegens]GJM50781.1 cation transporter [Capnocytophaga catalasegens]GJM51934.1 cation transporter [Capnocytophaga catalasegens]
MQGDIMKEKTAIKATYFSIVGNLGLALVKFLAGFFGNSYALIADAIESVTDTFASILVLVGLKYAEKPADENHPYGHGKIEALVTFVVVGFLITSAIVIAYQSVQNIRTPHTLPEKWTLLVLAIIILWKEISYRIVLKNSKLTNSTSLKADAWHHRADAITSVAAFVGITIALLLGEGYETADDWAALLASGIILYNAYAIFRPALGEILDEDIYDELSARIYEISKEVEGIIGIEKCHIRKVGMRYCVDLHVIVNGDISVKEGHDLAHILQHTLYKRVDTLTSVFIHIEPDYKEI